MKKYLLPLAITLSALSVSASAAFYSVYGLSKLFAGASLQVIIMAGSLEVAKLVVASLLYQYWNKINKILRAYLAIACIVLMFITSAGIYGFLSGAYQSTATQSEIVEKEMAVIEMKRERFEEKRFELREEKKQLNTSVKDLRMALSNPSQVQYIDRESGQLITTTSSSARRSLQKELKNSTIDRDKISIKLEAVTDSISKLDIAVLNKETSNEAERELGPLKYISELTGKPMSQVINWLLLLIIFVFDPLAISLVVAANFAFDQIRPKEKKLYKPEKNWIDENEEVKMSVPEGKEFNKPYPIPDLEEEEEKRMNIIGQNGNDGLHYENNELKEKIEELKNNINRIKSQGWMGSTLTAKIKPYQDKIDKLKKDDEENQITY
tara:strand:+ start:468 stop:1610 length:1143 start_codon:yes stop_codon:yes gene_type:complete